MSSGFPACSHALLAAGLLVALSACSSDLDGSAAPAATDAAAGDPIAAATAATVCGLLRDLDNDLADIANATALRARNTTDAHDRVGEVLTGFDQLLARIELHATAIGTLDPAQLAFGDTIVADLRRGADDAHAELVDERADFALLPAVEDGDLTGRIGQFFNAIEKTMSVVEPVLADDADAATYASFDAEPTCRFVVQHQG